MAEVRFDFEKRICYFGSVRTEGFNGRGGGVERRAYGVKRQTNSGIIE